MIHCELFLLLLIKSFVFVCTIIADIITPTTAIINPIIIKIHNILFKKGGLITKKIIYAKITIEEYIKSTLAQILCA